MLEISGLEFVTGVRSSSKTKARSIIFYNGQLTVELEALVVQAGVSGVLEKPLPIQGFLDLVGQLCKKREFSVQGNACVQ